MKTLKTKITATVLAAITCTSFAVQGREEELRYTPGICTVVSVDCFGNFLRNLKKINAIVYIPDSKIQNGMGMNLTRVQPGNITLNLGNYIRVQPVTKGSLKHGDECSSSVKVDFDNLNMIVYVEKSRLGELQGLNLSKVEGKFDQLFPKIEQAGQSKVFPKTEQAGQTKVFPKMGDKMFMKIEGKFHEFSQVEFKF
jgi:hypothetical protein